ncbi:MAG TPA: type II and III secretion system protein [Gallionella sp.]|jgi:general secretion pathway protein D|nr:type II and III secretion system protein [Gallionella sp.]
MRARNLIYLCAVSALLAGCGTKPIQPSDKHIQRQDSQPSAANIPQPLRGAASLPPPKPTPKVDTYSVVVTNVSAQEILFALARDAKINLDIHPGIQGVVTLNALNQTLPQILTRIAKQVDMRYELNDGNLTVMPDTPFLKHYKIDYVNMTRDTDGAMANATQVGSGAPTGGAAGASGNNSSLSIKNTSKNHFWETLIQNIKDILHGTDKEIIANPENGIITVRATSKQHEKIQEFVDQIMVNARRQVLIEVTVAEVTLNSNYQQGINWSKLIPGARGVTLTQAATGSLTSTNTGSMFVLNKTGSLSASVSLLESFGNVKVLSSPKLSVLNNQTAMLRVVDNLVYFTIKADTTTNQTSSTTTYTTTAITVPTGFTMSVTPQINDSDTVLINLRPSITRRIDWVNDPNPSLANPCGPNAPCPTQGVTSQIPVLQTREMESVMKIENNQIAVMGGLMQDESNNKTDGVPGLSGIPLAGNLFKNRNDTTTKTELVIFLRPMVIKDASINGDFSAYRDMLPDQDFFKEPDSDKP